jgi:hypothetical protein
MTRHGSRLRREDEDGVTPREGPLHLASPHREVRLIERKTQMRSDLWPIRCAARIATLDTDAAAQQ